MRRDQDDYENMDENEAGDNRPKMERINGKGAQKRISFARRGAPPTVYNGLHRRRKKRIMW